jgi:hypothetical protein
VIPNGKDLYIIQMAVTGDIKVGRSKNPHKRLKQLQTSCPHPLKLILHIPDEGFREREIHRIMHTRGTRHNGEWFEEGALAELPLEMYDLLDLNNQDWWMGQRTIPTQNLAPVQDPEPEWFKMLRDMGD